jgi:hypothetical protein
LALESGHVPPEVIRTLLASAQIPSWSALHRAAHAELERKDGPRFEENILNDVIAAARAREAAHAPFPPDFDSLVTEMNRAAKQVPHR